MHHDIEVAYLKIETADRAELDEFFATTIGLVPGEATSGGESTWCNDTAVHRILVGDGPSNDATVLGLEALDEAVYRTTAERLTTAGYELTDGTSGETRARRVADLKHTIAPWGTRVELVHGLERTATPFEAPLVAGGFLTDGVGFGHVVFGTTNLDESHRFVTDGLGMHQSDWIETALAPGVPLEVRFYHCNSRHHSLALALVPFAMPTALHHVMVETNHVDDTGRAFDRALASGRPIANSLGRHDNDEMFSFYVVSPAGFQVEVGHGARTIGEHWGGNRRYSLISRWGHQPVPQA
jgi:2,3-dihydroxybiphenyl 1,2-dioxygenase